MPKVTIENAGRFGVIKDLSAHDVKDGVFTDAEGVRFLDGMAYQFTDFEEVLGTPQCTPYFMLFTDIDGDFHWIYAGEEDIWDVYDDPSTGITHTDLSGTTYSGAKNAWTGTVLGGVPILNNGEDPPQMWDLNLANNFQDLSNWPSGVTCKSLRQYKNFLIAMNITDSGTEMPYLVRWGHPVGPGEVPSSWDYDDETVDAGRWNLAESPGHIIDGLQLRDSFIIYKEDSVHRMDYIGGTFVFSFQKVLGVTGAMNRNCIVEVDGVHFVLTTSDVVVHDGTSPTSVLDKVARRYLFTQMDADTRSLAFVYKNPYFNEVYVCYPSVGSTSCDRAMVWNYRDRTVSFRDMPNVLYGLYGSVLYDPTASWDSDSEPWDSDLTLWNNVVTIPGQARVVVASADDKFYLSDSIASTSGSPPSSYVERQGLSFKNPDRFKLVNWFRPRIKGTSGSVRIYMGGHDTDPFATPTYDQYQDFEIGVDTEVDFSCERRFVAFKIENLTSYQWRLDSYDIDFTLGGLW